VEVRVRVLIALTIAGCLPAEHGKDYQVASMAIEVGAYTREAPARFSSKPQLLPPCDEKHPCEGASKRATVESETPASPPEHANTYGGVARVEWLIGRHFYLAGDFEIGAVRSSARGFTTTDQGGVWGAGALAGVTGRTGRLSVAAEVGIGIERIMRHRDAGRGWLWFFADNRPIVEPRVRVDWWIHQHLSISAYAIVDDNGLHAGGLGLTGSIPARRQR
jgi:hypothetical protein